MKESVLRPAVGEDGENESLLIGKLPSPVCLAKPKLSGVVFREKQITHIQLVAFINQAGVRKKKKQQLMPSAELSPRVRASDEGRSAY